MTTEMWLAAAIGIPLLGGLVVLLWPDTIIRGLRPFLAVAVAALTVYCAVKVAALAGGMPLTGEVRALQLDGNPVEWSAPVEVPEGGALKVPWQSLLPKLTAAFYLDRLSTLVVLASTILVLLMTIYAWGGLSGNARRGEFLAYGLWALAGAVLAASADNLLLLLVGWELVSVMLFYLVTIGGDRARYSAGKTMVMLGLGDGALLLGIVLLFFVPDIHSLSLNRIINYTQPHPAIAGAGAGALALAAFGLFAVAGLVKAGAMPLHTWLPKAAEGAPPAAMALLPASVDKLLGIYLLARAGLFIFDWNGAGGFSPQLLLMVLGAGTVILSVMAALVQHDLKKLLAFHTVSQVGYMVMGIATGTTIGVMGGLFHMLNNSLYKSLLFLGAGAIEKRAGTTDLARLGGLGRKMPMTFMSMFVASMSISGVPPFNGFVSKWMIYAGLLQFAFTPDSSPLGAAAVIFLVLAMFGSALTLASFVKVLHSAFMGAPTRECQNAQEVGATMWSPMLVLSGLCLALGVAPYYLISSYLSPIAQEAGLPAVAGGVWNVPFGLGLAPAAGAFWNPMLAAGLIAVALAVGGLVFLMGTFRKARTVRPFHSGETSMFSTEETRFPGTGFYGTVTELFALRTIYRDAAEGAYDLYEIVGDVGERLVGLGKELHNGVLPTYLGFCMLGLLAILAALLLPLLFG